MSANEVRKLRARVYGECSDSNWEACRENWMREESILWLKREVEKEEMKGGRV